MAAALLAALCLATGVSSVFAANYNVYATGVANARSPQNWGMGKFKWGKDQRQDCKDLCAFEILLYCLTAMRHRSCLGVPRGPYGAEGGSTDSLVGRG